MRASTIECIPQSSKNFMYLRMCLLHVWIATQRHGRGASCFESRRFGQIDTLACQMQNRHPTDASPCHTVPVQLGTCSAWGIGHVRLAPFGKMGHSLDHFEVMTLAPAARCRAFYSLLNACLSASSACGSLKVADLKSAAFTRSPYGCVPAVCRGDAPHLFLQKPVQTSIRTRISAMLRPYTTVHYKNTACENQ